MECKVGEHPRRNHGDRAGSTECPAHQATLELPVVVVAKDDMLACDEVCIIAQQRQSCGNDAAAHECDNAAGALRVQISAQSCRPPKDAPGFAVERCRSKSLPMDLIGQSIERLRSGLVERKKRDLPVPTDQLKQHMRQDALRASSAGPHGFDHESCFVFSRHTLGRSAWKRLRRPQDSGRTIRYILDIAWRRSPQGASPRKHGHPTDPNRVATNRAQRA